MDYVRKYKLGDIQLKTSRKYIIITSFMVVITVIILLVVAIADLQNPKAWGIIGLILVITILVINTEIWSIKTKSNILNVKIGFIKHTIPFKDLIDIQSITRHNTKGTGYTKILKIIYKKNNKIKRVELTYKKTYIEIADETEIMEFINKFSKFEKDEYLNIRTQEEEKELEELLSKLLWSNELQYIEPKKVAIIIISTVVIMIGLILCFLIPYIIKCNN